MRTGTAAPDLDGEGAESAAVAQAEADPAFLGHLRGGAWAAVSAGKEAKDAEAVASSSYPPSFAPR